MTAMARPKALITGASGGMGRACARVLGATHDLVLGDISAEGLDRFAAELRGEGYTVAAALAGSLTDPSVISGLTASLAGPAPFVVVHTAGLSPSLASWRPILEVNLIATARLFDALEPLLVPGSVMVAIASMAGQMATDLGASAALLADPLADGFIDAMGVLLEAEVPDYPAGPAYSLSKREVIRQVERRAAAWGARGARIVSISPGVIHTPMGQKELADSPAAQHLARAAPAGRIGTAMDIATAVRFLVSAEASFITGCDLRVDGGATAAVASAM